MKTLRSRQNDQIKFEKQVHQGSLLSGWSILPCQIVYLV